MLDVCGSALAVCLKRLTSCCSARAASTWLRTDQARPRTKAARWLASRDALQQDALKRVLGDVVLLDQDLADELVGILVDVLAAADHLDGQVAVLLHEDEDVADLILASGWWSK